MVWCVAFEAKSIQSYILASGRLRDMVGASHLVDRLVNGPLQGLLDALGIDPDEIRFSRRAGGAFMAFLDDREKAERLRDAWSLLVPRYAPGLEFVLALEEGASAFEAAKNALATMAASRIPRPRFPSITPLARLAPRTGEPAVDEDTHAPDGPELVDAAVRRKRAFRRARDLERKFLGEKSGRFPTDMENEFPFRGDNRYVGIVHADGNGLGQMLMRLQQAAERAPERFVKLYDKFSKMLAAATEAAARRATEEVIVPRADARDFLPMRPLVLGGDDLTCIVRGDLALAFTRAFLDAFEEETRPLCAWLSKETDWEPVHLTACAGIAWVKANQPFALAYELAEELCGQAKDASGRACSAIAFHRVTTSFIPDADWVRDREMTTELGGERLVSTLGAYALREGVGLPSLDALLALARMLREKGERAGVSAMRRLLSLTGETPAELRRLYARWRALLEEDDRKLSQEFYRALATLLGQPMQDLPAREVAQGRYESPLGDVVALDAVEDMLSAPEEEYAGALA